MWFGAHVSHNITDLHVASIKQPKPALEIRPSLSVSVSTVRSHKGKGVLVRSLST
jgi:hypothetical protein